VRSISLWSWGSSSPKDTDFSKLHPPKEGSVPDSTLGHDGHILAQQTPPPSHPIPAVHQTSDIPPPSSLPSDPETTSSEVAASPLDQVISTTEEVPLPDILDPADALSSIPERIGYLKEVCGIDFGWGPSSMMEWVIEHIHIYGGFTWATSIVLLATFARLLIFIPMIRASDSGARIKAAQPILTPARERMRAAYEARDHRAIAEARAELKALQKEYKVNPFMMFIPVILQIPMQFGSFRTLRNMAELPVPAFEKENWLWTQDLTLGDPYFIIPAANAAIMYLTIKVCNWFTVRR
jgi:YidC/Oxa1 family membrane protein insertase